MVEIATETKLKIFWKYYLNLKSDKNLLGHYWEIRVWYAYRYVIFWNVHTYASELSTGRVDSRVGWGQKFYKINFCLLYIGWQWRNFFISAVFRHFGHGKALRNVCCSDISRRHFLNNIAIVRTIFLNQLIQFYSNNATNLHHLTTHSTTCWPTKWRSHCDHRYVTSLHPMWGYVPLIEIWTWPC